MKTLSYAALGAVLSLAISAPVQATPVTLEYLGAASGYRTLTIEEAPASVVAGTPPVNVVGGAFQMRDTTGPLGDFIAWCLDVSHWLASSGAHAYEITTTPFSSSYGLNATEQARVQGYFDANYVAGLEQNRNASAAFQMGLWEVLYDDDYSLSIDTAATDDFRGTVSHAATLANVEAYLLAASTYAGPKNWKVSYLESLTGKQNLVTVSAVPLPATGVMLLAGLGGFGMFARRRKA